MNMRMHATRLALLRGRTFGPVYAIFLFAGSPALADPVKIACQGETITIPGWGDGTMYLSYEGSGSNEKLSVKSPHLEFSVPASSHKFDKPLPPLVINAVGDTKSKMPDLKSVEACAAGKLSPDQKGDKDVYFMTALSCMEKAPASADPVPVHASATITFLAGEKANTLDPMVSVKLTYLEKNAAPDGKIDIDLMPKSCNIIP